MWLAMKLIVAQFHRARDHKIINEGAECEQSENAMQFLHHHQLATSIPPHSQSNVTHAVDGKYVFYGRRLTLHAFN